MANLAEMANVFQSHIKILIRQWHGNVIKVIFEIVHFITLNNPEHGAEIVTKYLGYHQKIRRPDFLKTLEYPNGLELDIYYGFAIEVQGEQHENMSNSFIEAIPINLLNSKSGINSR
ncbi:37793_t:CDS:2 [Gigaspora margarita]|uniref:37793_t:CDS:1 n=1 Tax=Gigaspora margarita TaxID=4874 RepID=A0ABN7VAP4_GIGMA|nr:37793_t:CDS:2 [Gigaspora margarita]